MDRIYEISLWVWFSSVIGFIISCITHNRLGYIVSLTLWVISAIIIHIRKENKG